MMVWLLFEMKIEVSLECEFSWAVLTFQLFDSFMANLVSSQVIFGLKNRFTEPALVLVV